MELSGLLEEIQTAIRPCIGQGRVADYIPALARVPADKFGMAVARVGGGSGSEPATELLGVGDFDEPFSIQSISKVFTLSLVLAREGDALWKRVGREPSGNPFNSLVQLEYEHGIPRNPFINAGALVVTDRLLTLTGDAVGTLRDFLRAETGNAALDFDPEEAASEAEHGHRNAALAHFLASWGNLQNPVDEVLGAYFRQCAFRMSCRELALAMGFLARHGVRTDGSRLFSRSDAKRLGSVMLTCGTYDAAGDFAYRVGLPGKSGVGGGVVAVIPERAALCAWSPGLDAHGNSVAAVAALDAFTTRTGWSIF